MASTDPLIRHATREDVPKIHALIHALALYENATSSVHATPASLLATLSFPPFPSPGYARTLLIFPPATTATDGSASAAADPAGFALYYPTYSTWRAAPGIWLEDLYVADEHRGKGYGKRLLQRLAREVRELPGGEGGEGGRLEWEVLRWNKPSIGFYESEAIGAKRMEEWVSMRVDGGELARLAARDGGEGAA